MLMKPRSKVAGLGPICRRTANSCESHGRQLIEEETAGPTLQGAGWPGLQMIGNEVSESVAWQCEQLRARHSTPARTPWSRVQGANAQDTRQIIEQYMLDGSWL